MKKIELQMFIELIKAEKEKAEKRYDGIKTLEYVRSYYGGAADAFSFILKEAELILNDDTGATPESCHFANTM